MPVYTCTTVECTLSADAKATLAREVARIHSDINHVPSTYVNVVFLELPAEASTPTASAVALDGCAAAPGDALALVPSIPARDRVTIDRVCSKAAPRISPSKPGGCCRIPVTKRSGLMRAIEVGHTGGPEVMRRVDVPVPSCGPGQVLIEAHAIGVNFIDTYFRSGLYPHSLPFTPGSEVSGTVAQLGDGVTEFAVETASSAPTRSAPTPNTALPQPNSS